MGDIHGEFTKLASALEHIGFDPDVDRLFSVGDLVDRGEDSAAALAWLRLPWFHAVLGNHEHMLMTLTGEALNDWLMANGGEWWLECGQSERQALLSLISQLPTVIEVATAGGTVGIVHADVPIDLTWRDFVRALNSGDDKVREHALWSRIRASGNADSEVSGILRVFCGHTPLDATKVVGNVHFIDTGACFDHKLTVVPVDGRKT